MIDEAFRSFFEGEFQRMLEAVEIPGASGGSWDRKAAYLLWLAMRNGGKVELPAPPKKGSIFE